MNRRTLIQALILMMLAMAAATIHYLRLPRGPRVVLQPVATATPPAGDHQPTTMGRAAATEPAGETVNVRKLTLDQAREEFNNGHAQFIDARNKEDFIPGHIAGAILLPVSAFAAGPPKETSELDRERLMIVYCGGGECEASSAVARQLALYGFTQLAVLEPGYPAWHQAGYPTLSGNEVQ